MPLENSNTVMSTSVHTKSICHKGTVQKTNNNSVLVIITAQSACSGCHAEEVCTLSGKEEKIIEVSGSYNVKPGDEVSVYMKQSTGYAALLLGYLMPLATVIISLIILNMLKISELAAGLISIAMLIPYFTILFLSRKLINNRFIFTLNS